ncbi:MAG: hypothetical protein ABIJ65_10000 [Chloroflexota bacterium]
MAYLTIFSAPKSFSDPHIATIQRNAIRSWRELGADVDVILVGEEEGLAEAARDLGVTHISQVSRNEHGTPLVSSIFTAARENSSSALLGYVNADILLLPDLLPAIRYMAEMVKEFILVGQRWDLDVWEVLDFSDGWATRLRHDINSHGKLHPPAGSDYFIFPRSCYQDIPDFAIGRAGWDNWMIYQARKQGWLAVDATRVITIVHQGHDYAHLPEGKTHRRVPETDENIRLAGGREITRFSLVDADRRLVTGLQIDRKWEMATLRRVIETYPLLAWNNYGMTSQITAFFHRLKYKLGKSKENK